MKNKVDFRKKVAYIPCSVSHASQDQCSPLSPPPPKNMPEKPNTGDQFKGPFVEDCTVLNGLPDNHARQLVKGSKANIERRQVS